MGVGFSPGWQAGLELQMSQKDSVTRLTRIRHRGPLRVQRPFYPGEDGDCHLYLLHPPGGMVTGDSLELDIQLDGQARGLLTTPSAGKIYRGNQTSDSQRQQVTIRLNDNSFLEWLPLETIAFDGARGELSLRLETDQSSRCALWDIVCLGRPAAAESFDHGYLNQRVEIFCEGAPVYVERNRFRGGAEKLVETWGLGGCSVFGTFLALGQTNTPVIDRLREKLTSGNATGEMVAVSLMENVLAIRYLGHSAESCRRYFLSAWRILKPLLMERHFIEPRIWRT